jgi:hypothetical protein
MRLTFLFFVLLFANVGCGETLYKFDGNTLSLPFATDKNLDRVYADFELKTDLTAFDQFQLTLMPRTRTRLAISPFTFVAAAVGTVSRHRP